MRDKYLKLYEEWMKTGELPNDGLCHSASGSLIELIMPTREESPEYFHNSTSGGYWAYDGTPYPAMSHLLEPMAEQRGTTKMAVKYSFTPLRQTILLLMHELDQDNQTL